MIGVLVLFVASAGWRWRGDIDAWLNPASPGVSKPIVFDNGTVREPPPPASQPFAARLSQVPGGLRKCVKGSQTSYTNFDCPAGFKERAVAADWVSVVDGRAGGSARAAGPASSSGNSAQKRLHDALDLSHDPRLRERVMDRAIDAGSR